MRKVVFTLFIISLMVLAACGEDHQVKSHVKQFMSEQMLLPDYDIISWSDLDSTNHVKDSILQVMHTEAIKGKIVKAGTKYQRRTDKLNMISVKYAVDKDTMTSTFYLDDKLTGIVGVKSVR